MTHTVAELAVSREAYDEIAGKLREADYGHVFLEDGLIDMQGIGLIPETSPRDAGPLKPVEDGTMKTRAKMYVDQVLSNTNGYWDGKGAQVREVVTLQCVTDEGSPENERFHGATPVGKLELHIDNPAIRGEFVPGREFYVDLTPAE